MCCNTNINTIVYKFGQTLNYLILLEARFIFSWDGGSNNQLGEFFEYWPSVHRPVWSLRLDSRAFWSPPPATLLTCFSTPHSSLGRVEASRTAERPPASPASPFLLSPMIQPPPPLHVLVPRATHRHE